MASPAALAPAWATPRLGPVLLPQGDPVSLRSLARALESAAAELEEQARRARRHLDGLPASWRGRLAESFLEAASPVVPDLARLAGILTDAALATRAYARTLEEAQELARRAARQAEEIEHHAERLDQRRRASLDPLELPGLLAEAAHLRLESLRVARLAQESREMAEEAARRAASAFEALAATIRRARPAPPRPSGLDLVARCGMPGSGEAAAAETAAACVRVAGSLRLVRGLRGELLVVPSTHTHESRAGKGGSGGRRPKEAARPRIETSEGFRKVRWTLARNALSDRETLQAERYVRYRGGHFEGQRASNTAGIDGTRDGRPVSLKEMERKVQEPPGLLELVRRAERDLRSAQVRGVEVVVEAPGLRSERLRSFVSGAGAGEITALVRRGYVREVHVRTAGGRWIRIGQESRQA